MDNRHEFTVRDYLKVLFRHKLVVISVFIVLMTATYIGVELRLPTYTSRVKILVPGTMQKDVEYLRELGGGSLTQTQAQLVMSNPVLERTVRELKLHQRPLDYHKKYASDLMKIFIDQETKRLESELESLSPVDRERFLIERAMNMLAERISISNPGIGSSLFYMSYTDFNAKDAGTIANVLSRSFVIFDIEQQIAELKLTYGEKNSTIVKLRDHIARLEKSLDGRILPHIEAIGPASVKIVGQASLGQRNPVKPSKTLALIIAFMMSFILGGILAFVFDYYDQTFKSPEEVENFLKIPLIGSIPKKESKDKLIIYNSSPVTKYTKSYYDLSEQIYLLFKNKDLKTFLITGAEGLNDNAAITLNVAKCLSYKAENKVLIIDANLGDRTTISSLLNISDTIGLTDIIQEQAVFDRVLQHVDSNLYVLPVGISSLNPISFFESPELSDLIKQARELFDIIFISCEDLKNSKDAVMLSSHADGIVLAITEGKVRKQVVRNAIAPLEQKKADLIGVILYNRRHILPEIIYKLA